MAYADFTLNKVAEQFSLRWDDRSKLFPSGTIAPIDLDPAFLSRLREDTHLALMIATDKARAEFIIAPILAEIRRQAKLGIGLHAGVEFDVDEAQGLVGCCDYILTRSPSQLLIEAPVLIVVEAKNEDMKKGYAECIVGMLAAQMFNEREGRQSEVVYGAVTTGDLWRFLRLGQQFINVDSQEYYIGNVAQIMGILRHIVMPHPTENN